MARFVYLSLLLSASSFANPLFEKRATCAAVRRHPARTPCLSTINRTDIAEKDNCARAVTGTAANVSPSLSVRKADCSSFFSTTVTPIVTTTVTQTSTSTSTYVAMTTVTTTIQGKKKRQATTVTAITQTPTAVPTYASACSGTVRYSSACSCFGVSRVTTTAPASTSTVTVTVSTTVASTTTTTIVAATATAQPSCGNAGMSWAYYQDYSRYWDPPTEKTMTPGNTGVTYNAHIYTNYGGHLDDDNRVYGTSEPQVEAYAVQQRGYIFATETGTYTFTATNVDDNVYMWLGPQAYSGWTIENAQLHTTFDPVAYRGGSATHSQDLVAGNFYAFRIAFRNNGGPGGFDFSVATPSGVQVLSSNSGASISVVQYSCDGTSAPAYAPFGQETECTLDEGLVRSRTHRSWPRYFAMLKKRAEE